MFVVKHYKSYEVIIISKFEFTMKKELTMEDLLGAPKSHIFEVRLRQSQILRTAGNDSFKEGKMDDAVALYERALFHANFEEAKMSFEFTDDRRFQIFNTIYPVYLNLARCSLQEGNARQAISFSLQALDSGDKEWLTPSTIAKIHFLKGKAFYQMGDFEEAEDEFSQASTLQPDDTSIMKLLRETKQKKIAQQKSSTKSWKGLLSSSSNVVKDGDQSNVVVSNIEPGSDKTTETLLHVVEMKLKNIAWSVILLFVVFVIILFSKYFDLKSFFQ